MTIQKQKMQFFEEILADFFQKTGRRELPWRKRNITAYEVWVSEIMLQQTQVSRVIGYYERFLENFPTVQKLAQASWEEFLPYYEGLGYYARGRNMLLAAQMVVAQYDGMFPKNKEELLALPGVGDYTASAILSFGYQKNFLAWDTNLKRVVGRFFYGSKKAPIDTLFFEERFVLPRRTLNAALMDFGSLVCTGTPKCANCPLQKKCQYFREKGTQEYKERKEISKFPLDQAIVTVFLHENHQKYFSVTSKKYQPFILPRGMTSRAEIKHYFGQRYGLKLSVRPPHKKIIRAGQGALSVNAQILTGKHTFTEFSKGAAQEYTEE